MPVDNATEPGHTGGSAGHRVQLGTPREKEESLVKIRITRKSARAAGLSTAGFVLAVGLAAQCQADTFHLGGGENYAILFQGGGGNTLQVTNVTVNGNIGVAGTG